MYAICSKTIKIDKLLSGKVLRVSLKGKMAEGNLQLDYKDGDILIHICSKEELENIIGYLGENIKEIKTTIVEDQIFETLFIVNVEEECVPVVEEERINSWEKAVKKILSCEDNEYISYNNTDKEISPQNLGRYIIFDNEHRNKSITEYINGQSEFWWVIKTQSDLRDLYQRTEIPSVEVWKHKEKENYLLVDYLSKVIRIYRKNNEDLTFDLGCMDVEWIKVDVSYQWGKIKQFIQIESERTFKILKDNLSELDLDLKALKRDRDVEKRLLLESFLHSNKEDIKDFDSQFEAVKKLKYIKNIYMDGGRISIDFNDLPCRAIDENNKVARTIKIPAFTIKLSSKREGSFQLEGYSNATELEGDTTLREFAHPHCPNERSGAQPGSACLGNYQSEIDRAAKDKDIYKLISLIREWVMTANINDQWGDRSLNKKIWSDWEEEKVDES